MDPVSIGVDCILLDIEGTTTSINFVKDVLFKYIRNNLSDFIKNHWNEPKIKESLQALKKQSEIDASHHIEGAVLIPSLPDKNATILEIETFQDAVISNVLWQMSSDRKTTALKALQGCMWTSSYDSGDIKGHIYDDVPEALKKWKDLGKQICIYSSGSVEAQKLLFGHSSAGDLTKYLDGYFDTLIGSKIESESYEKIAKKLGFAPSNILFLTDNPKEAQAAQTASMKTLLVIREGNAPISEEENCAQNIYSFSELNIL